MPQQVMIHNSKPQHNQGQNNWERVTKVQGSQASWFSNSPLCPSVPTSKMNLPLSSPPGSVDPITDDMSRSTQLDNKNSSSSPFTFTFVKHGDVRELKQASEGRHLKRLSQKSPTPAPLLPYWWQISPFYIRHIALIKGKGNPEIVNSQNSMDA